MCLEMEGADVSSVACYIQLCPLGGSTALQKPFVPLPTSPHPHECSWAGQAASQHGRTPDPTTVCAGEGGGPLYATCGAGSLTLFASPAAPSPWDVSSAPYWCEVPPPLCFGAWDQRASSAAAPSPQGSQLGSAPSSGVPGALWICPQTIHDLACIQLCWPSCVSWGGDFWLTLC